MTSAWSCTMRLVVEDDRALRRAAADLDVLLGRVDAAASRFRADSELSIANARAGRPTPVSRLLVRLVVAALDAARATDGLVDPSVGRNVRAIGYDRDIREIEPTGPAVRIAAPTASWRDVRVDRGIGLLTVPAGAALDLGATAKAWTADLAARTLSARYGTAVLVELGGDVATAGTRPEGWVLDVAERAGVDAEQVLITRGGVATSTTTIRRWRRGDDELHHIVDPRSGAPARPTWRTVSVYAPTALRANAASTAAIVSGADAVRRLEAQRFAARLVDREGRTTTTSAWPRRRSLAGAS
jgi:thiamine biosynthesis lipoprotein